MRQQEITEVEVVLSPTSGKGSLRFRVAVYPWQLQDMRRHSSYAEEVFDAFRTVVCGAHNLDPRACRINAHLEPLRGAADDLMYTGDVLSETLFLH